MYRLLLVPAVLGLSACSTMPKASAPLVDGGPQWRAVLTAEDARRIDDLPLICQRSLAALPPRYRAAAERHGGLLQPDTGRDHPAPPPGSYRCRLVKLGPSEKREPPLRNFPAFFCYVRAEQNNGLSFAKQTGTELPGGWLYPDGDRRLILAGARQRVAGDTSLGYGTDTQRDIVGTVERIGPFRWRLVLPWRGASTGLDAYELTPIPPDQQADEPRVTQVAPAKALRTP